MKNWFVGCYIAFLIILKRLNKTNYFKNTTWNFFMQHLLIYFVPIFTGALSLETAACVSMLKSTSILFSFLFTIAQGEEFTLDQTIGAIVIMATIILYGNESYLKRKFPKLDLKCRSCHLGNSRGAPKQTGDREDAVTD